MTGYMNGPSYRFRLERVRALRERREEQAKLDFAAALQQRGKAQDEVIRIDARIGDARGAQIRAVGSDLKAHQDYVERLEHLRRVAQEELVRREQELDARRQSLTKASQDREALERLKEKGLAAHIRELARVEQITLDEIAGNGHWRRAA